MAVSGWFARSFGGLALLVLLAACQSEEDRAAGHFASAQELLAAGDAPRAIVELRNALQLAPLLHEARAMLAATLLESGDLVGAYAQYAGLAELQPENVDAQVAVARILMSQGDWEGLATALAEAQRFGAEDPRVVALALALDYRRAVEAGNDTQRAVLARQAEAQRAANPDDPALVRIAIDRAVQTGQADEALAQIEALLAQQPRDYDIQATRLRLLLERGDLDGIAEQFRRMIALFPEDAALASDFLQWYLSREDLAGAEALLRDRAAAGGPAADEARLALVELLRASQGAEVALAEMDRMIAEAGEQPSADLYRAARASILFTEGERAAALESLAALLATAQPSDQTRRIMVLTAEMRQADGDRAGAEALVAQVLEEDAAQVDALRLRAGWRIADDRPGEAIIDLRTALNQAPDDVRLLTAMARAHQRDGSIELASEMLGRAVEVNPTDPETALQYAGFLRDQGRSEVAREVAYRAWQGNPGDVRLLEFLSALALAEDDRALAAEILSVLRSSETPQARDAADQFESALFVAQGRVDEAVALLAARAEAAEDRAPWILLQADALREAEREAEALALVVAALAEAPESRPLLLARAALERNTGDAATAEAIYRSLLEASPADTEAAAQLYGMLDAEGREAEAEALLDAALTAAPQSAGLLWARASRLQEAGDLAGAIAIYEALYADDSGNQVVANNLASLLAMTAQDAAQAERALRIARRFRASDRPEFQDTYGWALHRAGDSAGALAPLAAAAAALPDDPVVQYHHAAVLAAVGQSEAAQEVLARALPLFEGRALPQAEAALALRDALAAAPVAPAAPAPPAAP